MQRVGRSFLVKIPARRLCRQNPKLLFSNNVRKYANSTTPTENPTDIIQQILQNPSPSSYSKLLDCEEYASQPTPLPPSALAEIVRVAAAEQQSHVVRGVANDYLRMSEEDNNLALLLFEVAATTNFLSRTQVEDICRKFQVTATFQAMPTSHLVYLAHALCSDLSTDLQTIENIFSELVTRWQESQGVGHQSHFDGTWATFTIIRYLLKRDVAKANWSFRQALRSKPSWPEQATQIVNGIEGPAPVILTFMLRCCVSWRWWERAVEIALHILEAHVDEKLAPAVYRVLTDVTFAVVEGMGPQFNAPLCASLICAMADHALFPPVEDALIQRFYKACMDSEEPDPRTASQVYLYLRDKALVPTEKSKSTNSQDKPMQTKAPHAYIPPRGRAMIFLLDHYCKIHDQNSARLLILELQPRVRLMTPYFILQYLDRLIRLSFASLAREVWTLCYESANKQRRAIAGHLSICRQLVSLFVSRAESSLQKADAKPYRKDLYQTTSQEYLKFAHKVAGHFRNETVKDLQTADHRALTTFARIAMEVGWHGRALRCLEVICSRQDIVPDDHDVSVVLRAISSQHPPTASNLLDFMIRNGVEPHESAYGIIASQCLKHGMERLALEILQKGVERGCKNWDPQTLGAICWYAISQVPIQISPDPPRIKSTPDANASTSPSAHKELDRGAIIARLDLVLKLLGPRMDEETTAVFRERTLGIRAAEVALSVRRPDLAYRFWNRCIRDKSIVKQPDDIIVPLTQDPEKHLRARILQGLERWNRDGVPASLKQSLETTLTARPVQYQKRTRRPRKMSTNPVSPTEPIPPVNTVHPDDVEDTEHKP